MDFIQSKSTDPYFNIALESWLFDKHRGEVLLLYRNKPSIIVGKHQNAQAEVNIPFVIKENIPVIRRISGGGTVYHDLGNINYCIIINNEQNQIDYKKFLLPIQKVLRKLNIDTEIGIHNELTCDGLKISGTAQHISKGKTLHHGTLLFNTNIENLNESRNKNKARYSDKAIASNVSKVGNIIELHPKQGNITDFIFHITDHIFNEFHISEEITLTSDDQTEISNLIQTKFKNDQWNWGNSPKYKFKNNFRYQNEDFEIQFSTLSGIIGEIEIKNINEGENSLSKQIKAVLTNELHSNQLVNKLHNQLSDYHNISWENIIF